MGVCVWGGAGYRSEERQSLRRGTTESMVFTDTAVSWLLREQNYCSVCVCVLGGGGGGVESRDVVPLLTNVSHNLSLLFLGGWGGRGVVVGGRALRLKT